MNKIKNFILYGGLTRETYKKVRGRISDENRVSNNIFTLLGALAFLVLAISTKSHNEGVPSIVYYIGVMIFVLMFIFNLLFSKKMPIISDIFAIGFSIVLMGLGIYIAYGSRAERTTMLLPLFGLVSLVFCYRPIYLISILSIAEAVYLIIMKSAQPFELFYVNMINTLIFSIVGILGGTYTLLFKHKKHKADYEKQVLLENDTLTELYNRYSWNNALTKTEKTKSCIFICSLDINGLKKVNDTYGHIAGDELIIGAAMCIKDAFENYGDIYRIGGDEFSILIYKELDEQKVREEFLKITSKWKSPTCDELSISFGIARINYENDNAISEAIYEADQQMYIEKEKYHLTHK